MQQIAAFFDIDGTISRDGLIREMFKKMIKYELIDSSRYYNEVEPSYSKWDRRMGDYDTYLLKMVDIYSEAIKHTEAFHIAYIAKRVIEQRGDRVYTYTREKIKWHKAQGHKLIAISGSPIELVREMSQKYGMDDYRGTIYEKLENGTYSGSTIPMWDSRSKHKAILEMAEKYSLNLANCYAYGDTTGDLSMFRLVGKPFAINPTKELLTAILEEAALKEKINIIVERKDVTYRLHVDCLDLME